MNGLIFFLLVCASCTSLITLLMVSSFLIYDFIRIKRGKQEETLSNWSQYFKNHHRLKWTVLSLIVLQTLEGLGYGVALHFPSGLLLASVGSIFFVVVVIRLVSDLRKAHQGYREGVSSAWYKRPKILKQMALVAIILGFLFEAGYIGYAQSQGFPYSSFVLNIIFTGVIPGMFFFLSLILFLYATFLQVIYWFSY